LINWNEVLEALRRSDGQITDYGRPAGQVFFDPAVAVGERIEEEIFSLLCEEGWISTEDRGSVKRYRITETGMARLDLEEPQFKVAASAGSLR
jgi:hypothetical protein